MLYIDICTTRPTPICGSNLVINELAYVPVLAVLGYRRDDNGVTHVFFYDLRFVGQSLFFKMADKIALHFVAFRDIGQASMTYCEERYDDIYRDC